MHFSQKTLLKTIFAFVVAVVLCLPCPAKRELKQAFNIPVSEYVKTDFQSACTFSVPKENFSEASHQTNFKDFFKKSEPVNLFRFQRYYTAELILERNHFLKKYFIPDLPLFILNEKYLI